MTSSSPVLGAEERSAPAGVPLVAMVGAGQLARMTHQAAIALGVQLRVLGAAIDEPAARAGAQLVPGVAARLDDLRVLAVGADVVSFDHELVPPEHLAALEREGVRLAPPAAAKLLAQDKVHARQELARLGFPVPPFIHGRSRADAEAFAALHGLPLVAKAPRGGYDGRGVFQVATLDEVGDALAQSPDGLLLEPLLELERELSVLVARSPRGESVAYPVVETVQRDQMCREILAPAEISAAVADRARELALSIADAIGATGILAVELFDTPSGLLVNELALRPHNSGHWTIEGCITSQFEQHIRAVLDWPLGLTDLVAPAVATVNIVGVGDGSDPVLRVADALAVPGARLHLYGKQPRPGRKLGHVTVTAATLAEARERARRAASILEGSPE